MNHETTTTFYIGLENQNGEIHPEEVINFIRDYVDAGTFTEAKALWHGELENSLKFECVNFKDHVKESELDASIRRDDYFKVLKQELEEEFKQDSVLVKQDDVGVLF